jgi:hypothetical protein
MNNMWEFLTVRATSGQPIRKTLPSPLIRAEEDE